MGAGETKAGHEEEYVDGTSSAPWPQLDGVRPRTSPALVDDRRSEDEKAGKVRSPTMAPSPWGEVLLEDERKDSIAPGKTKMMGF